MLLIRDILLPKLSKLKWKFTLECTNQFCFIFCSWMGGWQCCLTCIYEKAGRRKKKIQEEKESGKKTPKTYMQFLCDFIYKLFTKKHLTSLTCSTDWHYLQCVHSSWAEMVLSSSSFPPCTPPPPRFYFPLDGNQLSSFSKRTKNQ